MSFFSMDSPLMRFLNRMADLIVLNLLSILFAIPTLISGYLTLAIYGETGQLPLVYLLITALLSFPVGASLTALHTVLIKMVKNEEGYIVKGFFKAFRDNFFQATAIGLLAAALTVLLIADLLIVKGWFRAFFAAAAFLLYGMLLYVYPLQARFYNPVGRTIRNSLLMEIAAFPRTLLMMAVSALALVLIYFAGNYAVPIAILFGISVPAYLQAMIYVPYFKRLEEKNPQKQEGE